MGLEVLYLCLRKTSRVLLCRRGGGAASVRCLEGQAGPWRLARAPVSVTVTSSQCARQRHICPSWDGGGAFPPARTEHFQWSHWKWDPWKCSLRAAGNRSLHQHHYWERGGGLGGPGRSLLSSTSTTTTGEAASLRGLCSQAAPGKQPHEPREGSSQSTTTTTTTPTATDPRNEPGDVTGQGLFKFKELYENPWTIPNLLCVCRIVLAPYLGHLIIQQHFHLSLVLFTLAGATDLLDGYIARTWPSQKSAMGSALDPLADKILISILYVSLTYAQLIPAPLTALVIFRDVGLIAAVFWVRYKTVPPPVTLSRFFNPCYATAQLKPTLFSKVNTAIQLLLVAASLAAPVFQYTDSILLQSLWYITAVTTTASGYSYWHYGRKTVEVLNSRKQPEQ